MYERILSGPINSMYLSVKINTIALNVIVPAIASVWILHDMNTGTDRRQFYRPRITFASHFGRSPALPPVWRTNIYIGNF